MKLSVRYIAFFLMMGLLLLPIPLLRDFHLESALIAAVIGCFWAMWSAAGCKPVNDSAQINKTLLSLYIAGAPIFFYSLITGCLSWHGIGFWILYPAPSVLFGYSIGRLLRILNVPYRRGIGMGILIFITVGILLIEFLRLPQVYFFNHVWGGWPGPIYDETVKVGVNLLYYRGLTLAWTGFIWWLPLFTKSSKAKVIVIVCSIVLIAGYLRLPEMGIVSPRGYVQEQLGGIKQTKHFTIYFDRSSYTNDEIGFIAEKHEFYFQQITEALDLSEQDFRKIESYLYAHPWQKKNLVGAKFTSYVPVWLDQDQLHIAKPQIDGSLKHEMVHVLSKQFGNSLFNASWSIGLIEGLAVAIAPTTSSESTINQIVVSETPYPTAEEMEHALSILGFWGGRSAVNYTQTGSFVQYLLNSYHTEKFKKAYKNADVAKEYQKSMDELVNEWHSVLDTVSIDSTDKQVADRLYGFPSLFEQECPHVQTKFAQYWDKYHYFMAEEDAANALNFLDEAKKEASGNLLVNTRWTYLNLEKGYIDQVMQQANKSDRSADVLMLYADAFMMNGEGDTAEIYLLEAANILEKKPNNSAKEALKVRQDRTQWRYHLQTVYDNKIWSDSIFKQMNHRTQVRALREAIKKGDIKYLKAKAPLIDINQLDSSYIDVYLQVIEQLAFFNETILVEKWLNSLQSIELRSRYRQRFNQSTKFVRYLNRN